MTICFEVCGKPVGKQRPRVVRNKSTGRVITYTPDKTKAYEQQIARAYKKASDGQGMFSDDVSINVTVIVMVKCPKRLIHKQPIVKPDIDNIAKTILDGLNGVAYKDDKQVVSLSISKVYGTEDSVVVRVTDNVWVADNG